MKKIRNYVSPYSMKSIEYNIPTEGWDDENGKIGGISKQDKKSKNWGILSLQGGPKKPKSKSVKTNISKSNLRDVNLKDEIDPVSKQYIYPYATIKQEGIDLIDNYKQEIKSLIYDKKFVFDETFEEIKKKNVCFTRKEFKNCSNIKEFLEVFKNNKSLIQDKTKSQNDKFIFFAPAGSGKSSLYSMNNLSVEDCVCLNVDLFRCFHTTNIDYIYSVCLTYYGVAEKVENDIVKQHKEPIQNHPVVMECGSYNAFKYKVNGPDQKNVSIVFTHPHNALERGLKRSLENGRALATQYALNSYNCDIYNVLFDFDTYKNNCKSLVLYNNNGYFDEKGNKIKRTKQFAHYDNKEQSLVVDDINCFLSAIAENNYNLLNLNANNSYELYRKDKENNINYGNIDSVNSGIKNLCLQFGSVVIGDNIKIQLDNAKEINSIKAEILQLKADKNNKNKIQEKEKELAEKMKKCKLLFTPLKINKNLTEKQQKALLENRIYDLKSSRLNDIYVMNSANNISYAKGVFTLRERNRSYEKKKQFGKYNII